MKTGLIILSLQNFYLNIDKSLSWYWIKANEY